MPREYQAVSGHFELLTRFSNQEHKVACQQGKAFLKLSNCCVYTGYTHTHSSLFMPSSLIFVD